MNKLSKHFTREEVACRCGCGFDSMDVETIKIAEEVRELIGGPVQVGSGCRCESHNRDVGGASKSLHVQARAMDLYVPHPERVYDWLCLKYPSKYGFGVYKTFVHVDTRTGAPARWRG